MSITYETILLGVNDLCFVHGEGFRVVESDIDMSIVLDGSIE